MVCLYCGNATSVTNSRYKKRNGVIWRRRLCASCGAILTTFEQYDLSTALLVKKRSGALQGFQRDKLLLSVARSIEHRRNASQSASELTNTIISLLLKHKPVVTTISSKDISQTTSLVLKRYDAASAIRYLSFQTPTSTKRDIRGMLK
jgi:transcriptional repressor NrdR